MRKTFMTAAIAGTVFALSACSDNADPVEQDNPDAAIGAPAVADADALDADAGLPLAVVDASTATVSELAAIDGIDTNLAAAIESARPFADVTAFNAVLLETLSEEEAADIRSRVFIPVNLNSATREEIALIPGMSDRMIGEFLEYRPYADMAEFNREIGKYVDEDEVARFGKYVTL